MKFEMKAKEINKGIKLVGYLVIGSCVDMAITAALSNLTGSKETKGLKKIGLAIGTMAISAYAGEKVMEHVEKSYDAVINPMIELIEDTFEEVEEEVTVEAEEVKID